MATNIPLYLTILLYTAGLAIAQQAVMRICCFSKSPGDYTPKCYECSRQVYPNALLACVNATEMPKNISYKAADCLEKNCLVEYPTQATFTLAAARQSPWFDFLSMMIKPLFDNTKQKRSVEANTVDDDERVDIVGEVFTFVDAKPIEFGEPEYS